MFRDQLKADVTRLTTSDEKAAASDLAMEPGECRRVDEVPAGRVFHLRVGSLYLRIDHDRLQEDSPAGMHYDQTYGRTTEVDPGEAFAYLHGEYDAIVTYRCLGCGTTFTQDDPKPCGCPVGSNRHSTEYPEGS